ncbi:MAG: Spy/CpxP family protein refolding chaperone [Burkholderiales bacterium]|nr:Spy/CpxP family protein refolding chaperone [Burkholderiales bacterium]
MNRTTIARGVASAILGTALIAAAIPALSQSPGEASRGGPRYSQMSEADRAQMRERMQAHMNQRLDRLAARLEIKASQQAAWETYRKARASVFDNRPQRPARDADAATLAKFRADMAQRRAEHLVTMADATAKLQQVLEPQQRKVLDEIARQSGARGKRGAHGSAQRRGGGQHHGFGYGGRA